MTEARASRRELAAVATALLLPIPLFVASGLRLPIPAAIERGLASLEPGGAFDSAVIEAPSVQREPSAGAAPGSSLPEATPTDGRRAASSIAIVAVTGGAAVRDEDQADSPGEGEGGPIPDPGDTPPPGGGGGDPERDPEADAPEPPSNRTPTEGGVSAPAAVSLDVDAAGVSAEITVAEDGVEVAGGGESVEVAVPAPPAPPAPLPPLPLLP